MKKLKDLLKRKSSQVPNNLNTLPLAPSQNLSKEQIDELSRRCSLTIGNISKMANRLERRNNWFQFLLLYYSIVGIINALIPKYFDLENSLPPFIFNAFEFWDVVIAIVLLIVSSQVALFKYPERIKACVNKLNEIKAFSIDMKKNAINHTYYDRYEQITKDFDFLFSRVDFYYSCIEFDAKNKNTKEVERHFSKGEKASIKLRVFLENSSYFILSVCPIITYLILIIVGFVK